MFRAVISDTPLYNDVANGFFENVDGTGFMGDISFISTMRALVAPRLKEGGKIFQSYSNNAANSALLKVERSSGEMKDFIRSMIGVREFNPDTIHINNIRSSDDDVETWQNIVSENLPKAYKGFEKLEKVSLFFRKTKKGFAVSCFINPEIRSVILCVNNLDIRTMHYLQVGIFAYFPWYFDPKDGVSVDERALIDSLRKETEDDYLAATAKIAEKYDFRTSAIKRMLKGFEKRQDQARAASVESEIHEIVTRINNLNSQIAGLLNSKHDKDIILLGLTTKLNEESDDSEIMNYFLANKKLNLVCVSGNTMRFVVKDYLRNYDEDALKKALENKRSYVYGAPSGSSVSGEDVARLMSAVFIDETIKLRVCAAYEFNLTGRVSALTGYSFGPEYKTYMPNPHIDQYRCMGNYDMIINELLRDHNYISALEQTIASCQSINFSDSTVMRAFMNTVYGVNIYNNRCFELPDGQVVNTAGAIEYLNREGK